MKGKPFYCKAIGSISCDYVCRFGKGYCDFDSRNIVNKQKRRLKNESDTEEVS